MINVYGVVYVFNASTWAARASRSLCVPGHPRLCRETMSEPWFKAFFLLAENKRYPKMKMDSVSCFSKCYTNVAHWPDLLPIQKLVKSMSHGRAGAVIPLYPCHTRRGFKPSHVITKSAVVINWPPRAWSPRFWSLKWVYEKPLSDVLALFDGNILMTNLFLVYLVYWKGMDWPESPSLSRIINSSVYPHSVSFKRRLRKINTPCWKNFSIERNTLYSKGLSHANMQFSISKCRNKFAFFKFSWIDSENGVPFSLFMCLGFQYNPAEG